MAFFELSIEDFEAFDISISDDGGFPGERANLVISCAEGSDELEFYFVSIATEEGGHELFKLRLIFGVSVFGRIHGEAEEGFVALFLESFEFTEGEIGVDKVLFCVVDFGFLFAEF